MDEGTYERGLVRRAAGGDGVALKLLLVGSNPRLNEHISRRIPADLWGAIGVEDIVQEAHMEVFTRIGAFDPQGPDAFYRWLATLALSRLRNAIKRARAFKRGGGRRGARTRNIQDSALGLLDTLAGPGRTPSRTAARTEAIEAVQAALAELPKDQRRAVWLVHIEERSVREAAAVMGRSKRAVSGLCRRGLEMLRKRLDRATGWLSSVG